MTTTTPRLRLLLALGLAWVGAAALVACTRRSGPAAGSPGGALSAPTGPRMDHAAHLDKGLECQNCHLENAVPGDPNEPRKPTYAACKECHDEEDAKLPDEKKVAKRFFDAAGNPTWASAVVPYGGDVTFRHAGHRKTACATCHGPMKGTERVEGWMFSMESCMACHAQKGGSNACETCHTTIRKDDAPDSHKHLWKQRHGQVTRSRMEVSDGRCALCHDKPTFCDTCHREEKPQSHTNLWRTTVHGVMAGMDRRSCQVCHETDYCVRCHEETEPRSHRAGWNSGPVRHCTECHFPISRKDQGCWLCHRENPEHESAPDQPPTHVPGLNCRLCHNLVGGGGAPPLNHPDNGTQCERCHH